MLPSRVDFDVWAGNTFRRLLKFEESPGVPFDLTGGMLVFRAVNGSAVIRMDTDDGTGLTITNAVAGEASLFLTVAQTRSLPSGKTRYELEYWAGGDQTSLLFGELNTTVWVNDDVEP